LSFLHAASKNGLDFQRCSLGSRNFWCIRSMF